jgi:hypothetical protein
MDTAFPESAAEVVVAAVFVPLPVTTIEGI